MQGTVVVELADRRRRRRRDGAFDDAAQALRAALEAGTRAVRDAIKELNVRVVAGKPLAAADPSGRFALNVNRPQDLGKRSVS